MTELSGRRVAVVGAGVLGLAVAVELAAAGAAVTVFEAQAGENASSVAAGMLAPGSEALLDPAATPHLALLQFALARWAAFAARWGIGLSVTGTRHVGAGWEALAERARALGIPSTRLADAGFGGPSLWLPGEAQVESGAALQRLRDALRNAGGDIPVARVELQAGELRVGETALRADAVVLATGAGSSAFAPLAPELASLAPIQGQLLRFASTGSGPMVRAPGVYLAPQPGALLVGATMAEGVAHLRADPAASQRLRDAAAALMPALAEQPAKDAVGVRVATPDGLPLAGPSSAPGVMLATGARRNGWLLAPLVAEMVAAYLAGRDPGPFAAALDPRRFAPQDPA